MMTKGPEEREQSDDRILGSGDFVESVLRDSDTSSISSKPTIDEDLQDVSEKSGISREQILGPSRSRIVSSARKQFFFKTYERGGATLTMLGRLTERSHVAVKMAIEEAKIGRMLE